MSGFRVMVVTEHPAMREVLTRLVEERGFEAYPAADGIDALRQIYHVLPRVIISDATLPNLSGFELLPFVRRRFPEIGVIALGEKGNDDSAHEIVADVLLTFEPPTPELLGDVLSGMMEQYPFRMDGEGGEVAERRSFRRLRSETSACSRCEHLQKEASLARMNSLLARVWLRLHSGDQEAERQDSEADCALTAIVSRISEHQRREHGVSERRTQMAIDGNAEQRLPQPCASPNC